MKKLTKWLWITSLTSLIMICICVLPLLLFSYSHLWAHSADYDHYADDFHTVKNYCQTQFPDEADKWLYVSHSRDHGHRLYDPDTNDYLEMPDDVLAALESICFNGFPHKDAALDAIRIQGDRVSFCIENGQYALAFSPNEKPSWVNSPDEGAEVKVKSLGNGWYHVVRRPD